MQSRIVLVFLIVAALVLASFRIPCTVPLHPRCEVEYVLDATPADYSPTQGHIRINGIRNSGFEEAGTYGIPADFWGYTNGYVYTSTNYTENVAQGSFAACMEAQTVPLCGGGSEISLISADLPDSPLIEFSTGVILSFSWYVSSCPDDGSFASVMVSIEDDLEEVKRIWYFLSSASTPDSNRSSDASFLIHGELGTWHQFERNVTSDYCCVFGNGSVDGTQHVSYLCFWVESAQINAPLTGMVYDDVVLDNGVSDDWITNGDFEMNDYSGWICHVRETPVYVTQSDDCTLGNHSLNITSGLTDLSSANCHLSQGLLHERALLAGPDSAILRFDWKYSFTESARERTWLKVIFRNHTGSYSIHFLLGNSSQNSNEENQFILERESPDTWQHSELDLVHYAALCNISDVWISEVEFYLLVLHHGAASLLVDNLQLLSLATGNLGFEMVGSEDLSYVPGWTCGGMGRVGLTQEVYSGEYAVNLTTKDYQLAAMHRGIGSAYRISDRLRLAWRLENMGGNSDTYALAQLSFSCGKGITFLFGSGNESRWLNSSAHVYLLADGYNTTSTWHSLDVGLNTVQELLNLTESEIEESSLTLRFYANSDGNETVSLVVDDVELLDPVTPVVETVGIPEITVGSQGAAVDWTAADSNPFKLMLHLNDSLLMESPWYSSPEVISLGLESFSIGFYNLTLLAIDSAMNVARGHVGLVVRHEDITTTSAGWTADPFLIMVSVASAAVIILLVPIAAKKWLVRDQS